MGMNMNDWIKERRRIHDAATEGPWEDSGGGEIDQHWSLTGPYKNISSTDVSCGSYCYGGTADGIHETEDVTAIVDAHNTLPALLTAVEKVLELHRPVRGESRRSPDVCAECDELAGELGYDSGGTIEWPCPTVRAIEGAINE